MPELHAPTRWLRQDRCVVLSHVVSGVAWEGAVETGMLGQMNFADPEQCTSSVRVYVEVESAVHCVLCCLRSSLDAAAGKTQCICKGCCRPELRAAMQRLELESFCNPPPSHVDLPRACHLCCCLYAPPKIIVITHQPPLFPQASLMTWSCITFL